MAYSYFYNPVNRKILPVKIYKNKKKSLFLSSLICWFILILQTASAQYTLNGSATQDNCHCYTLTPNGFTKSGSVWNNNKIDLSQSFSFTFNVYLGCNDSTGADGIAFVLQPISTSVGTTGGGLGYEGVSPSVGVTLDTWQNTINNDPYYDHLAIQINGDINHNTANNLAGPITISASSNNVEDCNWHILNISWDASAKKYEVYFDGALRLSLIKDFVTDIFKGDPKVFWGFTGSTGGSANLQQFCTTLSPAFNLLPRQKRCIGENIIFYDSSMSFGSISKRYWNFGDGTPIDSVNINPVHTYTAAKDYTVTLTIIGADGCLEVNTQTVRIGSKPVAAFAANNSCAGSLVLFNDSSYTSFGTLNNWYWNLGDGNTSLQQNPSIAYTIPGNKIVSLSVKSAEGCVSDTTYKTITIGSKPIADMNFANSCVNAIVNFTGINISGNIVQWKWSFGDGSTGSGIATQHIYSRTGNYAVTMYAVDQNGCISDTLKKMINIYGTSANAGNDTIAAPLQPIQLHAVGGLSYQWIPSTGLNNANIADPIAILSQSQTYVLRAFTPEGCETYDTLSIKIYNGPEIYVPTAFSPNNDGLNDVFKAVPIGISTFNYLKIYNRWGQQIFFTTDYRKGWDGRYKSIDQPSGIYIWMVSGMDFKGNTIAHKGTIMLLR